MGEAVTEIARAFVRQAKTQLSVATTPRDDRSAWAADAPCRNGHRDLRQLSAQSATYRGAVDFQDSIEPVSLCFGAMHAFSHDCISASRTFSKMRHRITVCCKKKFCEVLAKVGTGCAWADPNQAIYETFTTARPEKIPSASAMIRKRKYKSAICPTADGHRSKLIHLANHLISWTRGAHPNIAVRKRDPLTPPLIPTYAEGDSSRIRRIVSSMCGSRRMRCPQRKKFKSWSIR